MRQAQTVKSEVTQLEYSDGELTATHLQAANVLCETFQKCLTRDEYADSVKYSSHSTQQDHNDDLIVTFSETAVIEKLLKLKPDKAQGPDGVHPGA